MKKSLNYKYLNVLIILAIIYLIFLMRNLWVGAFLKAFKVLMPFIISFVIAYVLYPFLKFLTNKKFPRVISIFIIVSSVLLILGLVMYFVVPLVTNQLINLLSNLGKVTSDLAFKYNINSDAINSFISKYSVKITKYVTRLISEGNILGIISASVNYISKFIIISIVSIYFLYSMPEIRKVVKKYLSKKNKKTYNLISNIDKEIYSYLKGLGIFMVIQFFEYSILFLIIGHPNFLLLGTLACITTIVPYFGGIVTNLIALIIASVISPKLFILTLIITVIFPNIDGYIISPKIYGKTNELPALLTIFSVTIAGALFGFIGIVIAVPLTIIIMAIIRSYKSEISKKISDIKEKI